MKLLFASLIVGMFSLVPSVLFSNSSGYTPPKGMVLVSEGVYVMGSHKSLIELNPGDLFNTDRHTLGPENPAHNVEINSFYIDTHEVSHGTYMEFVKTKNEVVRMLDSRCVLFTSVGSLFKLIRFHPSKRNGSCLRGSLRNGKS